MLLAIVLVLLASVVTIPFNSIITVLSPLIVGINFHSITRRNKHTNTTHKQTTR